MRERGDEEHLLWAAAHKRSLYTFNVRDYCRLHAEFLVQGRSHAGIILAKQQHYSVGEQMRRLLKLIATKTAEEADEHIPIRPGADALLLMAMVHVLFDEDLVDLGSVADFVDGVDTVRELAADFTPEAVAGPCSIDAATVRRLARELSAAPTAAVYGRIGTCTRSSARCAAGSSTCSTR